jgi:hypothetical protein
MFILFDLFFYTAYAMQVRLLPLCNYYWVFPAAGVAVVAAICGLFL